jgi:uncharacterized protein YigE (DUF2233 family)
MQLAVETATNFMYFVCGVFFLKKDCLLVFIGTKLEKSRTEIPSNVKGPHINTNGKVHRKINA